MQKITQNLSRSREAGFCIDLREFVMYINSVTNNIDQYLNSKQDKIEKLQRQPIILRWSRSSNMKDEIYIIDKHVGYLLKQKGGIKKLEQWFLSDDKGFNAITAERYVINYLRQRNENIFDNLDPSGTDAYLELGDTKVGIEVTTLNSDVGSWILTERLTKFLDERDFLKDKSLEITYSQQKVSDATKGGTINNYIDEIGKAIVTNDNKAISKLGFSIKLNSRPGWISWDLGDGDSFPWFRALTDDLLSKLKAKEKVSQLKKFSRNLIFVGVNHASPSNWAFPSIFRDLGNGEIH